MMAALIDGSDIAAASGEVHTPTSIRSPKQLGDVALKVHVARIFFNCFRCFGGMLQVFHMDFAKVDLDVAYVAMPRHACV